MDRKIKQRSSFFEARIFGMVIGLLCFLIFALLRDQLFFDQIQLKITDLQMNYRNRTTVTMLQDGASHQVKNGTVSEDIVIVGVDNQSLTRFGQWPWPRYRHADMLNALNRISDPVQREAAVMPDFFFFDPGKNPGHDVLLRDAIVANGRTFLEGVLVSTPGMVSANPENEVVLNTILEEQGSFTRIAGNVERMDLFYTMESPLMPFAKAMKGYGHANFIKDDDNVFRRQVLVAKISRPQEYLIVGQFGLEALADLDNFTRYSWTDAEGRDIDIAKPANQAEFDSLMTMIKEKSPPAMEDTNGDGEPETFHLLLKSRVYYVPSITLRLALEYLQVPMDQVEVIMGQQIRLPNPTKLDKESGQRVAFTDALGKVQPEILIPIDDKGRMSINFVGVRSEEYGGQYQTFTVRPYYGYSRPSSDDPAEWPPTNGLQNNIVLAGAFSAGMADDEKNTPMGLMYGVEIHANALNSIITNNFLKYLPDSASILILLGLVMIVALVSTRITPNIALIITVGLMIAFFLATLFIFEATSTSVDFVQPSVAMLVTMIAIIGYRVATEEREKKRIRSMFGKYVSPQVVDQLIKQEPELGGVDKELTVLFSDIRGFTTLSESMSPQELVNHLNLYLGAMTDVIHEYYGTLDKYVGDEIMCFWGAPLPQADHALLACRCALRQMERLAELNAAWPPERRLDIGIGLNSGIMTVGNMGSAGRMNYTLMGDNVNLGARLEGTNKTYMTHIIISEYTYGLVKDQVIARELDNIRVKGKNKPVVIYELVGMRD